MIPLCGYSNIYFNPDVVPSIVNKQHIVCLCAKVCDGYKYSAVNTGKCAFSSRSLNHSHKDRNHCHGRGHVNAPGHGRGHVNAPGHGRGHVNAPCHGRGHVNAPCHGRGHANAPCHGRGHVNAPCHGRGHVNAPCYGRGHANAPCHEQIQNLPLLR